MNPKLAALITDLAADLKPEVEKIESGIKMTQNNYGRYMAMLSTVAQDKRTAQIVALALMEAGANRQGVTDALRLSFP